MDSARLSSFAIKGLRHSQIGNNLATRRMIRWRGVRVFALRVGLKSLSADEVTQKTKSFLTKDEVNGVMARRDKIVATFQGLIAKKGEAEVLY